MKKEFREKFGLQLKNALRQEGISQKKFAELIDVETPTVNRWINGAFLPGEDKFHEICRILNKPKEYFFSESMPDSKFAEIIGKQLGSIITDAKKSGASYEDMIDESFIFFMNETGRLREALELAKKEKIELGKTYALEAKKFSHIRPLLDLDLTQEEIESLIDVIKTARNQRGQKDRRRKKSS